MDIVFCQASGRYYAEHSKTIPTKFIRDKLIIIDGGDDIKNRLAVSSKYVDILLDPHEGRRKDGLHARDSGLNQVLCSLARKNHVAIGFSLCSILHANEKAIIIGRIMQNIILCRKYKVEIVIGSFAKDQSDLRNEKDIQAFFRVLGMTGKETAMDFVEQRLLYKKQIVHEGILRVEK